jgi:geranylgeranyl diphosphate synthase, type II
MTLVDVTRLDIEQITLPARNVEAYLTAFLRHRPLPENLKSAVEYGLLGGGKMIRPILVIRCCEAVGGRPEQALAAAAAVEMVHAFSLVHDDLPAMDDDDLRRGRPTLHKHAGEAMAVLAGDAMLALAFELITTRMKSADTALEVMRELSIGANDMIVGQVQDTMPRGEDETEDPQDPRDRLEEVHRNKTGALLRAACRMGGICGGGAGAQIAALTRYAEAVGLMFQAVDDLLDVTSTTDELGKAAQKDAERGKLTYPGVLGIEGTREQIERLHAGAFAALADFDRRADPLRELCDYLAVRQK